jgi:tyrosyl-tRNA synthetase
LDLEELNQIQASHDADPGQRVAHVRLAREVTQLVHGEEGVVAAERIAQAMFSNQLTSLSQGDLEQLAQDGLPTTLVSGDSISLLDALVDSGLAVTPKGEVTIGQARKLVKSNAVSVNGDKVSDPEMQLSKKDAMAERYLLVQKGKKNHHLLVFS